MRGRRRTRIHITAGFKADIASIEAFLANAQRAEAYAKLIDLIGTHVISALEAFPDIGRPFLDRYQGSVESAAALAALRRQTGTMVLREYLTDDYLILYSSGDGDAYLLSIRHHRQLSFDLGIHWR